MKSAIFALVCALLVSACGKSKDTNPLSGLSPDDYVVKARAEFHVTTDPSARPFRAAAQATQPVTVALSPSTTMTLDNASFTTPTITNAVMDFGSLKIATLTDNNLKVCGAGGNQPCGTALVRVFTTGTTGAGIFNAADNFGAPLTATLTTPLSVGLLVANAAVMQTMTIPATKKVVRLSDFSPAPNYNFKADFTNAGAGSYSTTIVVEYALAP